MTKAEEAALKRFPEEMTRIPYQDLIEDLGGKEYVDFNSMPRVYFQLGYEQAEKDLAPLIEAAMIVYEAWNGGTMDDVRKGMHELEKRFKEAKK